MADISKETYDAMVEKIARLHASSELRAEFKGFVDDLRSRRARILTYKAAIGNGDSTIPAEYVSTATSFYGLLGNALTQAEEDYEIFLTGYSPEVE